MISTMMRGQMRDRVSDYALQTVLSQIKYRSDTLSYALDKWQQGAKLDPLTKSRIRGAFEDRNPEQALIFMEARGWTRLADALRSAP